MKFTDIPEDQRPKIEFPCQYPIKVMGVAGDDFQNHVIEIVAVHAEIDLELIAQKQSSKGSFHSVTVTITATGEPQLQAIFDDLKRSDRIKMVL